jgi:crossover junction endodeoxyribonuclease RuvC
MMPSKKSTQTSPKILGIDPGTGRMGYGIIQHQGEKGLACLAYGCIETSKKTKKEHRLLQLHKALDSLIKKHGPKAMGIETLYFARNVNTALPVSEARGVALLLAASYGLSVFEYSPSQVKLAVAGYGKADKTQVQRMIQRILDLPELPKPDDAADALSVALACFLSSRGKG